MFITNRFRFLIKKPAAGFSMIEILVTIAITTVGLVGLASLQLQATKSTTDAGSRSQAIWILEDLSNRIKANATAYDSYSTGGSDYDCSATQPTICTAYHDGGSRIGASLTCTNDQQAASDLWELACGFSAEVDDHITKSSPADFIANPQLAVSVNTSTEAVTATISWDVRTSGTDADGNQVYAVSENTDSSRSSLSRVFYP